MKTGREQVRLNRFAQTIIDTAKTADGLPQKTLVWLPNCERVRRTGYTSRANSSRIGMAGTSPNTAPQGKPGVFGSVAGKDG